MKRLFFIYVFSLLLITPVLFVTTAVAQKPIRSSVPSNLAVLRQSWIVTRNAPLITEQPNPEEYQKDLRNNVEENKKRAERGLPPVYVPSAPIRQLTPVNNRDVYIYESRMKNNGSKKIKKITWEYVFFEPGTKRELGRKKFVSKITIRPGEEKNLTEKSSFPPSYIVAAATTGNTLPNQYTEEVIVRQIEYSDGSVWNL